jgi:hypothetical protein
LFDIAKAFCYSFFILYNILISVAIALSSKRRWRLSEIGNARSKSSSSRRKKELLPGSDIKTPVDVKNYLNQVEKTVMPAQWLTVKQALSPQSGHLVHFPHGIFSIDTEFGYRSKSEPRVLFQIAVFGASGQCLLDENIAHNGTIEELAESSSASTKDRFRRTVGRVYRVDFQNTEHKTRPVPGITLHQLAAKLIEIGMSKQSIMLDWSCNYCDRKVLVSNLQRIDCDEMVPPAAQWLSPLKEWRRLIPGLSSFALDYSFSLLYPVESLRPDLVQHHVARGDCEKLFLMVKKLVEYIVVE